MANFFGIPQDRTDLVILCSIILGAVILTLLLSLIQGIRKRPSAKIWILLFVVSLLLFCLVSFSLRSSDIPSAAQIAERKANENVEISNQEVVDTSIAFEEIYKAYKENELRADETYQYNRYQITAKVNAMETDGLFNLTGGATLTMEVKVDNTVVFFYAEFEKEQEEALKQINVGDTITFEGKCLSAGSWSDCKLVQ